MPINLEDSGVRVTDHVRPHAPSVMNTSHPSRTPRPDPSLPCPSSAAQTPLTRDLRSRSTEYAHERDWWALLVPKQAHMDQAHRAPCRQPPAVSALARMAAYPPVLRGQTGGGNFTRGRGWHSGRRGASAGLRASARPPVPLPSAVDADTQEQAIAMGRCFQTTHAAAGGWRGGLRGLVVAATLLLLGDPGS